MIRGPVDVWEVVAFLCDLGRWGLEILGAVFLGLLIAAFVVLL